MLRLASLLLAMAMAMASDAAAAPRPPVAGTVAIQFKDRDIREVLRSISVATGQSYIFGEELTGKLTISVPQRVSPAEALEVLDAALYMKGFVALPTQTGARKVLPLIEATASSPRRDLEPGSGEAGSRESAVTTLIRLESARAESVVSALKELVGANAAVFAYPPTNSIVLAGTEAQLHRLILLARTLDAASDIGVTVRALRHRDAEQTAALIDEVFNQKGVSPSERIEVWPDSRSGRLVMRASAERLAELRAFLDAFDVSDSGTGNIHVVRVLNRDPEQVAEILALLVKGAKAPKQAGPQVLAVPAGVGEELAGRDLAIQVDPPTRSLVIRADPATFDIVLDVISELDRLPARISIDVLVVELSHPSSLTLGVDALLPLTDPSSIGDPVAFLLSNPSGGGPPVQKPADSVLFSRYTRAPVLVNVTDAAGNPSVLVVPRENVSLEASAGNVDSNVRLHPQLIVTSGEQHEIFSGNNVPMPVAAAAGAGADAAPTQTLEGVDAGTATPPTSSPFVGSFLGTRQEIQRNDVGVRLRLEPTIGEAGVVDLDLELEISAVIPSLVGDVEAVGPSLEQRTIQAHLKLREGQYAVVGSSSGRSRSEVRTGIPWLMDIPILGLLFSRIEKRLVDTELVALVHARVLRDPSEDVAETIRRRLAFERSLSRVNDLTSLSDAPYAVLLETLRNESEARRIADAFTSDGFETRVSAWEQRGNSLWDVYVTGVASLADAGELAMRLNDAGWNSEVTVLPGEGELVEKPD